LNNVSEIVDEEVEGGATLGDGAEETVYRAYDVGDGAADELCCVADGRDEKGVQVQGVENATDDIDKVTWISMSVKRTRQDQPYGKRNSPSLMTNSTSASTSEMVMLIFSTATCTPAFNWTKFATLAFKFKSALNFSTVNSMRPTCSSGILR
jgi:hypothetical protein